MVNVGTRLSVTARQNPTGLAVVEAERGRARQPARYRQVTFRQLDDDSTLLADGLLALGVKPGMRLILMVRPGVDFISLVFALFKAGVVAVLIDPGMGRRKLIRCLEEIEPDGFVAIPLVHAVRTVLRRRFPQARFQVTVGRRWFWGGATLAQLRARQLRREFQPATTAADDPAAIIFTTGSTGPPKGVLYRHGNFDRQVDELRDFYHVQPGEVDVAAFPLFALFNCAMGVTTVVPDMDPTRPAQVDPRKIVQAIHDWNATQAFGSPAVWNVVGRYCEEHRLELPTLRRVLSAGAPVPPHVLQRMKRAIHPQGDVHTPYGATESLPVASISASEVLGETAAQSAQGAGTCVGRRFPGITWKIIRIDDGPIATIDRAADLPPGEIGELIVKGPVVTREYVTRVEANALHKIREGSDIWHRMGDVGYRDDDDRFWFCGRKAHRVLTADGPLYTIPCEAIFNQHPAVYRSALVGVGVAGQQRPVIIFETWPDRRPTTRQQQQTLIDELLQRARAHPLTQSIQDILIHPNLPVDIRHNAKIFREQLAVWAADRLGSRG
jgi:acyl-CoA synthetase (AMP-forming)/AMP-acid ligase II